MNCIRISVNERHNFIVEMPGTLPLEVEFTETIKSNMDRWLEYLIRREDELQCEEKARQRGTQEAE